MEMLQSTLPEFSLTNLISKMMMIQGLAQSQAKGV
jgi:hypothetical protein